MIDKINGRTPEEIKKLLSNHKCYILNLETLCADAFAYIQQLERERDEAIELIGKLIVILKEYPRAATNGCAFQAYMEIKKYLLNIRRVEVE